MEPWDKARHDRKVGAAWQECGERVPGYLSKNARWPGLLVQQHMFRLVRQLIDPKSRSSWKSDPEVKKKVEAVAVKLAAEPRFEGKFRPPRQQEREEPRIN